MGGEKRTQALNIARALFSRSERERLASDDWLWQVANSRAPTRCEIHAGADFGCHSGWVDYAEEWGQFTVLS